MPNLTLKARALLLDMDGTLVNSDAVVERVWRAWAESHGIDPARVFAIMHGRQGHATMAALLPDRPGHVNHEENAGLLAQETADVAGVVAIPGAPAFLEAARRVPHALVTSADLALATARMGAAGLAMPDVLITAESVSASKPDPEGFLKGAAELGADPADCVVFEDSAAGIAAARAAGMRVVGIGARAAGLEPTAHAATLEQVTLTPEPDGTARLTITP
ncbi:HAD-IA family hydrolase [Streptomyces radicis]|uniref:HAD family hydrolase n=1 Tax=Streptomyces radicis TaxID=1750517 RepID=A0A3A9WFK7_9ACTN|nr:HAD-IA family hydrolase [Streptomyces radicis]RKN12081.1 HAD family hydrolase [Streptomyces radicis]RKN25867.1 HAD family hydrolase [Streptomyces radicis]